MPLPEEARKGGKNNVDVAAAGSYGGELKPQLIENGLGDDAATEPLREDSQAKKEPPATTGTNPKRTENSHPD